jgi:hypothetical protein
MFRVRPRRVVALADREHGAAEMATRTTCRSSLQQRRLDGTRALASFPMRAVALAAAITVSCGREPAVCIEDTLDAGTRPRPEISTERWDELPILDSRTNAESAEPPDDALRRCDSIFEISSASDATEVCSPLCGNKQCGPDGCGGSCGDCSSTTPCLESGCDTFTGQCLLTRIDGCCVSDADCMDSDPCTTDSCEEETWACTNSPVVGCCIADEECGDDNPCTIDSCIESTCASESVEGCCTSDADCDVDESACSLEYCNLDKGLCEFLLVPPPGGCCFTTWDCDDGDPCTDESCVEQVCVYKVLCQK